MPRQRGVGVGREPRQRSSRILRAAFGRRRSRTAWRRRKPARPEQTAGRPAGSPRFHGHHRLRAVPLHCRGGTPRCCSRWAPWPPPPQHGAAPPPRTAPSLGAWRASCASHEGLLNAPRALCVMKKKAACHVIDPCAYCLHQWVCTVESFSDLLVCCISQSEASTQITCFHLANQKKNMRIVPGLCRMLGQLQPGDPNGHDICPFLSVWVAKRTGGHGRTGRHGRCTERCCPIW